MATPIHVTLHARRQSAQQFLAAAWWLARQARGATKMVAKAFGARVQALTDQGIAELAECDRIEREDRKAQRRARPVPFARWDPC